VPAEAWVGRGGDSDSSQVEMPEGDFF
jgi:hypothetical protein